MAPYLTGGLVALSGVLLYGTLASQAPPLTQRDVDQTVADALASVTPPPAFSEFVYQAVQPSLVLIETTGPPAAGQSRTTRAASAAASSSTTTATS